MDLEAAHDTGRGAFPATKVERRSGAMRIGKHEWRVVAFWHPGMEARDGGGWDEVEKLCIGYEWRRAGTGEDWREDREWPRYDAHKGETAGLPRTLLKLWERCPWAKGPLPVRPLPAPRAA